MGTQYTTLGEIATRAGYPGLLNMGEWRRSLMYP